MKKRANMLLLVACGAVLFSCAPVIDRSVMQDAAQDVSFRALRQNPGEHTGKLYVFGGVIVGTKFSGQGTVIEAMHVPVDRYGYFQDRGQSQGRFLALSPENGPLLDPEVFTKGRRITVAGEFRELRKGRIDEMEYTYPVFVIRDIHLWPRERTYYPAYYDPWFYPYPYYYWDPWWRYPYSFNYYYGPYYRTQPPSVRPSPPGEPLPPRFQRAPQQRQAPQQPQNPAPLPERRSPEGAR